ncbi:alpha/beta hydrolase [Alphaproteobacteria bacterium AO1-B]|nr:alpha/beta hydrolase [Alphaproteobacteria bacterium AO1-B]
MKDIFDAFEKGQNEFLNSLNDATAWGPSERFTALQAQGAELSNLAELMGRGLSKHFEKITADHKGRWQLGLADMGKAVEDLTDAQRDGTLFDACQSYWKDAAQRAVLTMDVLRQRGDIFLEHEEAGCPPVLIYDYDVVMDGADLPRPCCYQLLRIKAPEDGDHREMKPWKRPYVIIDPRAGHGAGIGGFKPDSQVGVALRDGHPVYFIAFKRMPEKGQTLADVTHAEAAFVRRIMEEHPDAPNPIITGNCQGGWATLLLAATNPDLTGPIVLNGAPVSTWAGRVGENPMRYNGGILGGTYNAMFYSDLGHGVFDGADIVQNFEMLNPARNYFGKYYDLYSKVDTEPHRFLEFERWWGGYFLLNEAEMKWIVEQLFVGNKLSKNEAQLEPGRNIDIKQIRAPIIAFASFGDNITPPQQALNWIIDTYSDEREIAIRGQRIIYMVHDQVGHLGIFVSSKIAKKEHTEVTSTLKTIEALAPGLYEMKIDDYEGGLMEREFTVSFHERKMEDLMKIDDGRDDEIPFAAVARASEQQAEFYDVAVRPFVQAGVTEQSAELRRKTHPLRVQRAIMSSLNPMFGGLPGMAERVKEDRTPADANNPFSEMERVSAAMIEQSLDLFRDLRDTWYENLFYTVWGSPYMRWFGRTHQPGRTLKRKEDLRSLPPVQAALMHIEEGGFCEAVIRMLILLADSRGNVRRDRLERSARVLTQDEPFKSLSPDARSFMLQEQTLIVEFAREQAIESLPKLLKTKEDREMASKVVRYIPGAIDEMTPHTLEMVQTFQSVLGLPPVSEDITSDPLVSSEAGAPDADGDTPKVTEKAASASPAPQKASAPKRAARKAPAKPAAARKPAPRKPRSTAGKKEEPAE